jgi:cytochrome P450
MLLIFTVALALVGVPLFLALLAVTYMLFLYLFLSDEKGLPTVKGRHWFWGHLKLIGHPSQFFNKLSEFASSLPEAGAFNIYLPGFNRKYVAVSHLSGINELHKLRPFEVVRAQSALEEIAPGLFAAEGDVWRKDRRIVAPAFNHSHIALSLPSLHLTGTRLVNKWVKLSDASPTNTVVINEDCKRFTSDTTALVSFAFDFNSLTRECQEASDLAGCLKILFDRQVAGPFKYWKIPFFRRYTKFKRENEILTRLDNMIGAVVDDFQKNPTRSMSDADRVGTILNKMVTLNKEEGEAGRVSRKRLIGNVLTLFVAGTDTTSITIQWMLYFICQEPELQARLREEAKAFDFNDLNKAGIRLDAVLSRLPLMHAVFLETLRTHGPVGSITFFNATKIFALGQNWEPGQKFSLMYDYAMKSKEAGAEELFGAEPEKWKPDRWIDETGVVKNASTLLSFGNGQRMCPGRDLAKVEAVVAVSMVVKKFAAGLKLEPGHEKVGRVQEATIVPSVDIRIQMFQ